jgi:hypothetical protein
MEEAIPCGVLVRLPYCVVPEIQVPDTEGEHSQIC